MSINVIHRQANDDNKTPKLLARDFNIKELLIPDVLKLSKKGEDVHFNLSDFTVQRQTKRLAYSFYTSHENDLGILETNDNEYVIILL
jgi:hypothetical protein